MICTLPEICVSKRHGGSFCVANRTLTHDFVDFAILLATNELFVLVGQLDLDSDLIGSSLDKGDLVDDHHRRLDSVIRAVNGKGELLKAYVGT